MSDTQQTAIARLQERLDALKERLDYAGKARRATELEARSHAEGFWNDPESAQRVMKDLANLRDENGRIEGVERALQDAREVLELFGDDPQAARDADAGIAIAAGAIGELEMAANFSGEFDAHNAIVSIFAGAGGVDAADWTQMLARMYLRWAEAKGFKTQIVDESPAEEAGLKSVTFFVRGRNAYGMLESERGVHRLVRLSPFDAAHRRHTSFAAVDVIPEIEAGEKLDVEIKPDDLRIETFKSGGAGGQYVNKTESAVRIVHLPTGIIVASQQERSQAQNRDVATNILRAKLVQRAIEERESKLAGLRGERQANEWGSQIRSYVLQPYQLVKDHRTDVETGNAQAVLDGELDGFIWPYLQRRRAAV
ncbi:MAG: peptide chain release factor 2 [Candidatus Eremiobacteraeota bacterium]|nr:peptide chain release factor 2 [Candidatus Eremiobacteraeota bacterium]MBV8721772.1 peptide chain release factor 2 [Candidatus Eremiobacteraeota bacterium]